MNSKVKFNRNGNLGKLLNKLQKLNRQKVQIGYFQSQGIHTPSELHYTELMRIHEYGTDTIKARPVFAGAWYTLAEEVRGKAFKVTMTNYLNRYVKEAENFNNDKLLDYVGQWGVRYVQSVFGDPVLGVTWNPTPLIDTGELSENVAWKVTLRGKVHTL